MTKYYSPPEIAELLRVHHGQVLGWIRSGELRASNLAANRDGKQPRFKVAESDLETFLQARSNRESVEAAS